ncbi:MAG: hypothetical protein JW717_04520 [Marinilabiliaceae bacterium]|nr:hypothetical protein [Marinilabiliaceae bacterium]
MTKLSIILNYVLFGLILITLVIMALFYFGGELEGAANPTPLYYENSLNWSIILIVIASVATIGFEIYNMILHPKNAIRTLTSMGLLIAVFVVSYLFSDGTPLKIVGYEGSDNVPSVLITTDTMVIGTYILFGVAVFSILYIEISRLFK